MSSDSASTLDLAQHFLIAMPGMEDDLFAQSVVYICEHGAHGALGLVINKPADLLLDDLFEQVSMPLGRKDLQGTSILWGGPVQTERGFVLHPRVEDPESKLSAYDSSMTMADGLQLTTSRDILQELSEGRGPERLLVTLGYSAWDGGQLEDELKRNSWLTVPASHAVMFDTPVSQRYEKAMELLGIHPGMLSSAAGRA